MRLLRLFDGEQGQELPLAYLHRDRQGRTLCNGSPRQVSLLAPGQAGVDGEGRLFLTLAPYASPAPGDFLALAGGQCLLRMPEGVGDGALELKSPGFASISCDVELWPCLRAGVLTVSDKGARGEREDTAGPALAELVEAQGAVVLQREVVPDDPGRIRDTVVRWCEQERLHLVLCTGGTGIGPRDRTPEALLELADRVVPGFGETMRLRTLAHTPRAFLTRGLAVTRGTTLVVAFPGSERGARQCFEAIVPGLRHGVETLVGMASECGGTHAH
ncbi:MogA/MoaB family molybdenum cofactor biosynthesis protein [Aminomonas paucivorans]|uniref:MogA/MoaB family molybdenum cofactor biosynthesis protein n=1 Tax=Aminomonas paucivorans TaxID=81412 RepID=UPI00331670FB